MKGFYFITDEDLSIAGNKSDVAAAVKAGAEMIQLRNKNGTTASFYKEAVELKKLCRGAKFIVNDRVDIALAAEADGVHIGSDDLPVHAVRRIMGEDKIIGVTVRTLEEALSAEREGADYVGAGPVYSTSTKKDAGPPSGIALLRQIRQSCSLPIAAIGGISLDNAGDVIQAGADMICAVSAAVGAADVEKTVQEFQNFFV